MSEILAKAAWRARLTSREIAIAPPPPRPRPIVRDFRPPVLLPPPTGGELVKQIVRTVAVEFGVTPLDIIGTSKLKRIVWPRYIAIHLARKLLTRWSLNQLGRQFRRNHATILHGLRTIQARLNDPDVSGLSKQIERLERRLMR